MNEDQQLESTKGNQPAVKLEDGQSVGHAFGSRVREFLKKWFLPRLEGPYRPAPIIENVALASLTGFITLLIFLGFSFLRNPSGWIEYLQWIPKDARAPMWTFVFSNLGVLLGALFAGWIWACNYMQKQQINDQKERDLNNQVKSLTDQQDRFDKQQDENKAVRHAADSQFNARLLADQHQFQRRVLEERFNRILDDFANDDPATRAGAASRFASIAKTTEPGAAEGGFLTELNNPYYMPAVRQLSQRMVMEGNRRVGKSILEAFKEIATWTDSVLKKRQEDSNDEPQKTVLELLADLNRDAYAEWLESFAKVIRINVLDSDLQDQKYADMDFSEVLYDILENEDFKHVPSESRWYGDDDTNTSALVDHFGYSAFRRSFFSGSEKDSLHLSAQLTLSTDRLKFSIDALTHCLSLLNRSVRANERSARTIRLSGTFFPNVSLGRSFIAPMYTWPAMSFSFADLRRSNFKEADFKGSWFLSSNLQGVNLEGANLASCHFREANLSHANLSRTDLERASFAKVDLEHADLRWAHLRRANLVHAKMADSDLTQAFVYQADLTTAMFLPISALNAEFRKAEADTENGGWIAAGRPLNDEEYRHYVSVKQMLVDQETIPPDYVGPHDRPNPDTPSGPHDQPSQ